MTRTGSSYYPNSGTGHPEGSTDCSQTPASVAPVDHPPLLPDADEVAAYLGALMDQVRERAEACRDDNSLWAQYAMWNNLVYDLGNAIEEFEHHRMDIER